MKTATADKSTVVSVVEKAAARPRTEPRHVALTREKPASRQGDIILCMAPADFKRGDEITQASVQLAQGTTRGSRHIAHLPEGWRAYRTDGIFRATGNLLANVLLVPPSAGGTITIDHPEHAAHVVTVPAGANLLACSQIDHASEALARVRD